MTNPERNPERSGNTNKDLREDVEVENISDGDEFENMNDEIKKFKIRAKNIILTINQKSLEFENEIYNYMKLKNANYILICSHDKPQYHHHMYVQFPDYRIISSDKLHGSHVEKCFGSAQQNIRYLKGEDEKHRELNIKCVKIIEDGEVRNRGGFNYSVKEIEEMTEEDIKNLNVHLYNTVKRIKNDLEEKDAIDDWLNVKPLTVEWHFGMSGTGKTYYAKTIGRNYRKMNYSVMIMTFDKNGFAHILGDKNCKLLIINEFRDSRFDFTDFLEILTNEHQYNLKGGSCYLRKLEKIIITTQQSPCDIYNYIHEDRNQIYRRISNLYIHYKNEEKYEMEELNINDYINTPKPITISFQ